MSAGTVVVCGRAIADAITWESTLTFHSAYLLTTAAFPLVFGKLYTFYPIKIVFLNAIAIFELGSLICGVAPNSVALIVGRAIAGLGSASFLAPT